MQICTHQWLLSFTEDVMIPWGKKLKDGFINFQRQGKTQETHKSIKVSSLGMGEAGSPSLSSFGERSFGKDSLIEKPV